jgi:hypothetical protein
MTFDTVGQANPEANAPLPGSVAGKPSRPINPLLTPLDAAQALAASQGSPSGDDALGHAGALTASGPTAATAIEGSRPAAVSPLAYSRESLARSLGIGVATLDRWEAAGRIGPKPLRINGPRGRKLYYVEEVSDWLKAGAPPRHEWQAIRSRRPR